MNKTITIAQLEAWKIKENDAGMIPTEIDKSLAVATAALQSGDTVSAQTHITAAHMAIAKLGLIQAEVAKIRKEVADGFVIVNPTTHTNVGDVNSSGTDELPWNQYGIDHAPWNPNGIDPRTTKITHRDWAFYFKHHLQSRIFEIFTSRPKYFNPDPNPVAQTQADYLYSNRDADFRNLDGSYMDLTGYDGVFAMYGPK